jgi:hypothetical protein
MRFGVGQRAILVDMTHSSAAAMGAAYPLGHPFTRAIGDDAWVRPVHWCVRLGAAACFIGHGAFGIITKSAWVPYFALVGIPSELAYTLMPVVGTIDILMGFAVLITPRPFVLLYMVVWATWTSLLRPLTGDPVFETLERAGNYGVPLAMLLLLGWPRSRRGWFAGGDGAPATRPTLRRLLQWTTALLLFGHGALAAITGKALFATHYATLGLPASVAPVIGWAEIAMSALVLVSSAPALFIGVAVWKLMTESLFPLAGAPIWEVVERGGSFAAPLAVALMSMGRDATAHARRRFT